MMLSILAIKIGDVSTINWMNQLSRFFSFSDTSVQLALVGSMLLGLSCGVLGSFLLVRKQALYGDTLSHAVLPGIALAFIFTLSKSALPLLLGATIAAILAAIFFEKLKNTTVIKIDCSMGLTLAGFYAIGIGLLTMIQNIPTAQQAGLDKFLFGQASALSPEDIILMGVATLMSMGIIGLLYKQFLATSFDKQFARIIGIKTQFFNGLLTVLTAITIVISIKAVGVILVSAMLIIPAACGILLATRLHQVIFIAAGVGIFSGVCGTTISFTGHNLPTGPFMVVSAAVIFTLIFLCHPRHGVIAKWRESREHSVH